MTRKTNQVEAVNRDHTGSLLTQPVSHGGQRPSSREYPNGDDDPFPVQEATEQVTDPLHPPIFVAQ